jgi:protein-disulfide isomerase
MSRNRTVERRKEREQQKKRQRQTTIVIGLVVFAIIAAGLFLLTSQPAEAPIPAEVAARYEGIPKSETDEGYPVLGSDDAPVKVLEYASFDCSHCREFHETVASTVIDRVRQGQVQFTYMPLFGTGGISNGEGAARAALCVAKQGKFWEFHDALFDWQGLYANTAFSDQRLKTGITNVGVDRAQWDTCMAQNLPQTTLDAALRASQLQNITGTPAIVVNGTMLPVFDLATVTTAIDQAFAQSGLPAAVIGTDATEEATAEATVEATTETVSDATEEAVEATAEATAEATTEATAESTTAP